MSYTQIILGALAVIVTTGIFFLGILFNWLKTDLNQLNTKLDLHVNEHIGFRCRSKKS